MKLEIMTGQPQAMVKDSFEKLLTENGVYIGDITQTSFMIFPEAKLIHPAILYQLIVDRVNQHIIDNKDLFILTYSDLVFLATRVAIKRNEFDDAMLHYIKDNGECHYITINKYGHCSTYCDVFGVSDRALDELIGLSNNDIDDPWLDEL